MKQSSPPSVTSLTHLTTKELRALWPQWFDAPPPKRWRRGLLVRMLAYRIQERQHGGLSTKTKTQLRVLAKARTTQSVQRLVETPRLTPGTQVMREWGNEMHHVTVETTAFVYRGRRYRSLSAIARTITGTRWSGPLFFGVKPSGKQQVSCKEVHG